MLSNAYISLVAWDIELHPEVVSWLHGLSDRDYENIIAGDKTNDWLEWYKRSIPIADKRLNQHLKDLKGREK